jgi:hypothetical protein
MPLGSAGDSWDDAVGLGLAGEAGGRPFRPTITRHNRLVNLYSGTRISSVDARRQLDAARVPDVGDRVDRGGHDLRPPRGLDKRPPRCRFLAV